MKALSGYLDTSSTTAVVILSQPQVIDVQKFNAKIIMLLFFLLILTSHHLSVYGWIRVKYSIV